MSKDVVFFNDFKIKCELVEILMKFLDILFINKLIV